MNSPLTELSKKQGAANSYPCMDDAPKDATPILAWLPRKRAWVAVHWRPGWKGWFTIPGEYCVEPSRWMPMPASPDATSSGT